MKKKYFYILIAIFVFVGFSKQINAQNRIPDEHYMGVQGGFGVSRINITLNSDLYFQQSLSGGLVYEYFNHKFFGLRAELNYSEKGGKDFFEKKFLTDTIGLPDKTPVIINLKYIEIPVTTVLHLGKNKNKFGLNIGPFVSYVFNQKMTFPENSLNTNPFEKIQRSFEAGVKVGLNYARLFESSKLGISATYTHSYLGIFESEVINSSLANQNQVLTISLYYLLKTGKKQ
jgi:hypothetical protein